MKQKPVEGSAAEEATESAAVEAKEDGGTNQNVVGVAGHGKRTAHMVVSPVPVHPGSAAKC